MKNIAKYQMKSVSSNLYEVYRFSYQLISIFVCIIRPAVSYTIWQPLDSHLNLPPPVPPPPPELWNLFLSGNLLQPPFSAQFQSAETPAG